MTTAIDSNVIIALWDRGPGPLLTLDDRLYRVAFPGLKLLRI